MSLNISSTELEEYVIAHESSRRAAHSISCGRTMERIFVKFPQLAEEYGPEAAMCTGLMHDIAREWKAEELAAYVERQHIPTEPEEDASPVLLHAPVGAHLAQTLVTDFPEAWATAIRWHTLGSSSMGRLGAVLYIADYLEPLRAHITEEERMELLALPGLEKIILALLERDASWRQRKGIALAKVSAGMRDFLEQGGVFS